MDVGIHKAMCAAMTDITAITKDRTNTQQGFKFRGIDDVYNELHSILAKHQIFTLPEVMEDRTEERTTKSGSALIYRILKIKYTFYHSDGSSVSTVVIGEGMDSGDKASNKAMAIGHKYSLFQAFLIPTEEDKDPDAQTHVVQPKKKEEQKPEPPPKTVEAPTPTPTESSKEMLMRELDSYCTDAEGKFDPDMCNAILAEIAETKSGPLTWDKLGKLDAVKWEKWISGILEKYRNRG